MQIVNTLKVLNYHPITKISKFGALFKFFKYRFLFNLLSHPFVYSSFTFKNTVKFVIKDLEQYQIVYTEGLPEFYELGFLLHFTRPGDIFIDIGANRGLFSIIASGYTGAKSISFEPVPDTFSDLAENVRLNNLTDQIQLVNAGIGSQTSKALFSTNHGSANSIVTEANTQKNHENTVEIQVYRMDEVIHSLNNPALLKIDVEGFELEVLKGAKEVLSNQMLKALIIELNGSCKKFNYDEGDIHQLLLSYDFKPYRYYPLTRELILQDGYRSYIDKKYMSDNTIYIRDYNFVKNRIDSADKVTTKKISF